MSALNCFSFYWLILLVVFTAYVCYIYIVKPAQKRRESFANYSQDRFNNFIETVDTLVLNYFYGGKVNEKIIKRLNDVKTKREEIIHAQRSVKSGIKNSNRTLAESIKKFETAIILLQKEAHSEPELYILLHEKMRTFGLDEYIVE